MSYKIVAYALVKNINKAYAINLRPPEAGTPISTAMTASDHPRCKLPDPWLLDKISVAIMSSEQITPGRQRRRRKQERGKGLCRPAVLLRFGY
jgi:hypothetical protein